MTEADVKSGNRLMHAVDGFAAAWMLLLRLPLPRALHPVPATKAGEAVWAFPLIGSLIGVNSGAAFVATIAIGLPLELGVVTALAVSIFLTGGLHEDGLADMADGFGGGQSRARKLEIMRDSQVGSFGVLALVLSLAARGFALAALPSPAIFAVLVTSHTVSRAVLAVPLILFAPARPDGVHRSAGRPGLGAVVIALALACGIAATLVPASMAVIVTAAGILGALGVGLLARAQIGGLTGDVLGAAEQIAEICVLWALVVLLAGTGA